MVPAEGFEPTHSCEYWILNPARLPVPPRRLVSLPFRTVGHARKCKLRMLDVRFGQTARSRLGSLEPAVRLDYLQTARRSKNFAQDDRIA
jgi:hypothetical protein